MEKSKWRSKKSLRSMTAITLLLAGTLLLLWGVSMVCMTVVTAQELYNNLYAASEEFIDYAAMCGEINMYYDDAYGRYGWQYEHPDQLDNCMLRAIRLADGYSRYTSGSLDDLWFMRDIKIPMEKAVVFYDKNGNILHKNGNFIYFWYATEEDWDAGKEEKGYSYGWIDIGEDREDDPYARFRVMYAGTHSLYDIRVLRITGTMDGTEVKPAAIYYLTDTMVRQALEQIEPTERSFEEDGTQYISYSYLHSDLDRAGLLDWQLQFDNTAEVENKDALVTIYAFSPDIYIYEGSSLQYQGGRYDSLLALTEELDFPSWTEVYKYGGMKGMGEYSLNRILHFSGYTYRDWSQEDSEPDFMMVTAIMSHPLRAAVSGLRNVYIGTGLLVLILLLVLRGSIKKHLVEPICDMNNGMANGWGHVYTPDNRPPMWREAETLYEQYTSEADSRRFRSNEITRLNTALNYAKQAEQQRRQMTSNIAHELKTPLAVVHSYAEGLKEHIAEEKREQYLDVILSETERMDAMVLEMLDLSRLEAGKVKLSRDEFSLSLLARSVFEKLERMARERELQVNFELDETCEILADEARIGQVITNFATNAIKYTPQGGSILVKTSRERSEVKFSVENDSEPFSQEALSKVWDAFYRTDKARTGEGTGLGLAIAKSIIELHGGACAVRNTKTGVEFSFTVPI